MNLILLEASDFALTCEINAQSDTRARAENTVLLTDRRFQHIRTVHKAVPGQYLKVGMLNANIGSAKVLSIDNDSVLLQPVFDKAPPAPLALTLIIALPRPKMLKRILQSVAGLGVKKIYFINSYKVDKSYWSTPILQEHAIKEQLLLGLEQAVDTVLPNIELRKRFKPFVEDELASISANTQKYVAHPYQSIQGIVASTEQSTLIIGPEGGFIEYEIDKLKQLGFQSISLGERILKVESAIPVAITKVCQF